MIFMFHVNFVLAIRTEQNWMKSNSIDMLYLDSKYTNFPKWLHPESEHIMKRQLNLHTILILTEDSQPGYH